LSYPKRIPEWRADVRHHLNALLLLGKPVNLMEHSTAISTMVRIAARIGVERIPKNINPTLGDYLRAEEAR
jgi:hypothetical protein